MTIENEDNELSDDEIKRPSVADMLGTKWGRIHNDVSRVLPSRRRSARLIEEIEIEDEENYDEG